MKKKNTWAINIISHIKRNFLGFHFNSYICDIMIAKKRQNKKYYEKEIKVNVENLISRIILANDDLYADN